MEKVLKKEDVVELEYARLMNDIFGRTAHGKLKTTDLLYRGYANWLQDEYDLDYDAMDIVHAVAAKKAKYD
jgi:hypothetical protein